MVELSRTEHGMDSQNVYTTRMYLPAYLISPSPTAILQSSNTENQNRNRSRREEVDIAMNDRRAAGEERARMRYRMNTHPRGI